MMRVAGRSFPCWYMMLGRYLGTGKHGGMYLVSGCVLSVKVQPSGLLQELSWLMLAPSVSCQVMSCGGSPSVIGRGYLLKIAVAWGLTVEFLSINGGLT